MTRQIRDVAEQGGERRAQLVRCVGEEAPLDLARSLEAREHRVQRLGEAPDLVVGSRDRQPTARIARALDVRGGVGEARERPECPAEQNEDAERGKRRRDHARKDEQQTKVAERALDVFLRCGDDDRASGGRASEIGERSCVQPQSLAVRDLGRVRALSPHDRARGELPCRKQPTAE